MFNLHCYRAKISDFLGSYRPLKSSPDYHNLFNFTNRYIRNVQELCSYQTMGLSDNALTEQNGFGQAAGHHLVAIHQRQQKAEVLLRPAKVIAKRRAPTMTVRLQSILK